MGLFARLFSTPERQLQIATECLRAGNNARAAKAADLAIEMLQRRSAGTPSAAAKTLLNEAHFLRALLYLKGGSHAQAFKFFMLCPDCVPREPSCLAFVVKEALKSRGVPIRSYPLMVEYVANPQLRRSGPEYRETAAKIRKLLRPDPGDPGSLAMAERWNAAVLAKSDDLPGVTIISRSSRPRVPIGTHAAHSYRSPWRSIAET